MNRLFVRLLALHVKVLLLQEVILRQVARLLQLLACAPVVDVEPRDGHPIVGVQIGSDSLLVSLGGQIRFRLHRRAIWPAIVVDQLEV